MPEYYLFPDHSAITAHQSLVQTSEPLTNHPLLLYRMIVLAWLEILGVTTHQLNFFCASVLKMRISLTPSGLSRHR
jgi:hypothetical protein